MSRKLSTLVFAAVVCAGSMSLIGCGPSPPSTTGVKSQTTEDTTKQIQDAMKSGKIDPAKYGKTQN